MAIWIISLLSIVGVLFRPFKIPEWVWAIAGALLLLIFRSISLSSAGHAIGEGVDVYFFLIGMMLLSELAREEGLFDYLAGTATTHSKGSSFRLFVLIYLAGILVTMFLSNDATAVVMTPAVFAAVKKAGAKPLPYLFACAFIANAASFLLPISNPANLVVYGNHLPAITHWLGMYALPSVLSIVATFLVLWIYFKKDLSERLEYHSSESKPKLKTSGKFAALSLVGVVIVMLTASALELEIGLPTFIAAGVAVFCVSYKERKWPKKMLKDISWGVIPLVAGLFVIVKAVAEAGALDFTHHLLKATSEISGLLGKIYVAFGVGIASNLANNLPVGLISGKAVQMDGISETIKKAVLIGVDLGPNLSVTGSLATILWLIALRREGRKTSGFAFLKVGLLAMPIALILAILFV